MDVQIQERIDLLVSQVAALWMTEIGGLPPMSLALRIREDFDSHTHALAEKIRSEAEEWDGWPEKQAVMRRTADDVDSQVANMHKVLDRWAPESGTS